MNKDLQIREAIVLAGGLGTRLRSEIGEYPKPLAPINQSTFLHYLFDYLQHNKIQKIILAVGYKWQLIQQMFGNNYNGIEIIYSTEDKPLGTGGAIKLALEKIECDSCFVINGDTLFNISLQEFGLFHSQQSFNCSIALKNVPFGDRYGSIQVDENGKIVGFTEKVVGSEATINGGIYCINKTALTQFKPLERFSFEKEYLEKEALKGNLSGIVFNAYFKDIGIPEDYKQFETDLQTGRIKL